MERMMKANQALLDAIFDKYGGQSKFAKRLNMKKQVAALWKAKCRVPLHRIGDVREEFQIPEWGLNYLELKHLHGDAPSWPMVVKSYGLEKHVEQSIVKLGAK